MSMTTTNHAKPGSILQIMRKHVDACRRSPLQVDRYDPIKLLSALDFKKVLVLPCRGNVATFKRLSGTKFDSPQGLGVICGNCSSMKMP